MKTRVLLLCCIHLSLVACGSGSSSSSVNPPPQPPPPGQTVDQRLNLLIARHQLTGNPTTGRNLPSIQDPKAQLGMKLFFSKGLGGDMDTACASCHHPVLGGGDNLSLSIGTAAENPDLLGPGRRHAVTGTNYDGGPTVPRNAPSTFNMGLWDQVLFVDGRVESLSKTAGTNGSDGDISTPDSGFATADPNAGNNLTMAQSRFPVTSPEEMRGFTLEAGQPNATLRTHLIERFNGTLDELPANNWLVEFQVAFERPGDNAVTLITESNIFEAISEYERSQVFVNTPWKNYINGNTSAISEQAKQGAILFYTARSEGGANCVSCHSGDFYTDEKFHVVAMPQIGRGKGNGTDGTDDFGRFNVTGLAEDMYAFRTPTLLNVEVTGPWGHAGAYTSLKETVRHHSNPQLAINNYNFIQIDPSINATKMKAHTQLAMDALIARRLAGQTPVIEDLNLSETQIEQIVAFLETLTDPCVTDRLCIGKWIPTAEHSNPDLLRLNAIDKNGDYL